MADPFKLNDFLPFQLTALAEAMSRSLASQYREPYDITVPEWRVLASLNHDGSIRASELGRRTSMEKPRVSRTLAKMEKRGLIDKMSETSDSRVRIIRLTPAGRALYAKIEPIAIEWEHKLLADLTNAEIKCVHSVLLKLTKQIQQLES